MAVTENSYTGNGSTTQYSFTFPYLKSTDVQVQVDAAVTTAWAFANATTVQFNTAPSNGAKIKILRDTNVDSLAATFYAGSSIKSEDLNDNYTQNLYKTQEVGARFFSNTGGTMTGDLTLAEDVELIFEGATDDAHETKLTVADPTADRVITLPNVTGTVVTTGDTGTVATGMIAADAVNGTKIADDSINSEHYVDGSIDTAHIADSQVTTAKIADNQITTAKIVDANVTTAKIADNAVTMAKLNSGTLPTDVTVASANLVDGTIATADIADNAVTMAKLNSGALPTDITVASANLVDGTVATADIADASITTAKIADSNVTTAKIADDNVTMAKLASGTLPTDITVASANIVDGTIVAADLASNSVTSAKIADDAVGSTELGDGVIDTVHVGAAQITTAKIADSNVTTAKITDANVTTAKIADDAITIGKIGCEQTTLSNSDSHIPTSGAVVDYVAAQIAPLGGLEVIATEVAFPNTQPSAGVVISISDAGGVVFNGSGTSTTGRTVGGSTVTINNAPSSLNSETLVAGVGLMVSSTGSSQIYNYHKILGKEDDIKQLSDDINDFNARYRVGSSNPTSALDAGDLFFNTSTQKLLVYNSTNSAWEEAQSIGNFFISTFSEAFDGSRTQFTLSNAPTNVQQVLLSLNGVVQKPGTAFTLSGSTVTLASAPASGTDYFAVVMGSTVNIGQPSNNTVSTAVLQNGAVTTAKIADDAVTTAKLAFPIDLADNEKIRFGTGTDLQIFHDGSNSYIQDSGTGNLILQATEFRVIGYNTGESAIHANENGAVELYHNSTKRFETTSSGVEIPNALFVGEKIDLPDHTSGSNGMILLGTGDDLYMYHDGTNSHLRNNTGTFNIRSTNFRLTDAAIQHVYLKTNDSGNDDIKLYYDNNVKLATTSAGVEVTGNVIPDANNTRNVGDGTTNFNSIWASTRFRGNDNVSLQLGNSVDFKIRHDGTYNLIEAPTGADLEIRSGTGDNANKTCAKFIHAGAVELYHDNSKKLETTSSGASITGQLAINNTSGVAGQGELAFGASGRPFIEAFDSGNHGSGAAMNFRTGAGDYMAKMKFDGSVELYYDNSLKLKTINEGVEIKGSLYPETDNLRDLGSTSKRWRNIYTGDLNLSNKGSSNDVDGTWGDWTIQEGESDLFLKNNRSGKKYKFNLTEVS